MLQLFGPILNQHQIRRRRRYRACVDEQLVVIRSLGEAGNRALDVSTSLKKAVNELLADVGVREEWKPSH